MADSDEIKYRVNPARAGMIPFLKAFTIDSLCKPRASGDDPLLNGGPVRIDL